jgi:hypothetical protein
LPVAKENNPIILLRCQGHSRSAGLLNDDIYSRIKDLT